MSGNKIGFNEITEIGFNGNYGADLNSRLKAINDNFQKIANADYMKGVDGDDVRVLNAGFAVGVDGDTNPLSEGNLYYNNGEKITKGSLYTSISNCIARLASNEDEKNSINEINWADGLLENNSIMIIVDEENGNYYLKSSLYFVYNDPRFANPTESAAYGNLKNLSCVVTYDGENWVASQPFPKIYYSADVNDFCWEINGQRTKLIARGPQGLSGQNYPVWLCYSNSANINDISTTDDNKTISITIDGIYRFDGTNYNYITPENATQWNAIINSGEFKNNMALCIVHTPSAENQPQPIIRLYCGYLYLNPDNNLSIYTTQNSAIDTIIGHETLYSLLKSNSPGNTIQNSLFIPTSSVNADGGLSGEPIYSIYGLNETVSSQTYHAFNIGVSTVNENDDQTLTPRYDRTKLNLWSGEINFFTHKDANGVKKNALQITPGIINIHRNLISDHNNNGIPHRYIQMKLPESYLTFESYTQRNLSDSLSPIDTAMNPEACANRLSFYNPDLVDIEYLKYSTDEDTGETISTWEDCFIDEDPDVAYKIKTNLLTTGFKDTLSNLYLGKKFNTNGNFTNKDKLRVSIYIKPGEFYGRIDKLNLYTAFRSATAGNLKMNCKIYLYKITNNIRINREEFDRDIKKYYNGEKTWEGLDVTGQQTITIENPWVITTKDGTNPTGEPTYTHENLSGEPGWGSIALHDSNIIGSYNNTNYLNYYNFTANRTYKIVLEFGLEGPDAYQNESGVWVNTSLVARVGGIRLFGSKWYTVKDKNGNTNSLAGYNSICSWDENGVVLFPAGVSNQFKITYNKLKDLADNGKLAPGTKYRITDYIPKFNGIDIKSGNHQFDIIVEAVDNKTLSENANAVLHDGDTYFENSKLNKWELKYSLNTSGFDWVTANDPGVIYYMKDEFDNEAPYDFKNMMFKLPNFDGVDNNWHNWLDALKYILIEFTKNYAEDYIHYCSDNSDGVKDVYDKSNVEKRYFYDVWIDKYKNKKPIKSDGPIKGVVIKNNIGTVADEYKQHIKFVFESISYYGIWTQLSTHTQKYPLYDYKQNDLKNGIKLYSQKNDIYLYTFSEFNIKKINSKVLSHTFIESYTPNFIEDDYNITIEWIGLGYERSGINDFGEIATIEDFDVYTDYKIEITGDSSMKNVCHNNVIKGNYKKDESIIKNRPISGQVNDSYINKNVFFNLHPALYNYLFVGFNDDYTDATTGVIDIDPDKYYEYSPVYDSSYNIIGEGSSDNYFGPFVKHNKLGDFCKNNYFQYSCENNILRNNCLKNLFSFACSGNELGFYCIGNYFYHNCIENKIHGAIPDYQNIVYIDLDLSSDSSDQPEDSKFFGGQYNTIHELCSGNIISRGCHYNTLQSECHHNIIIPDSWRMNIPKYTIGGRLWNYIEYTGDSEMAYAESRFIYDSCKYETRED